MKIFQADVCVVGAGPGGALLSLLLARRNMSVILLERHTDIGQEFRGEHLNEEGEAILKKHGLFDSVAARGMLKMEHLEYWHEGKLFKSIEPDPAVGHLGIHVPQIHLLSAIVEEAEKHAGFSLMTGTRVTELYQNADGRYTGVRALQGSEEIRIESQFIVGADGRFSTIRKMANIEAEKTNHGYDVLWAKIPAPSDWSPSIKMALVGGTQLSLFTQAKGFIQIGWNIEKGSYSSLRKEPFEPFLDLVVEAFPQLEEQARQHIKSWKDFVVLDVYSSMANSWGGEGVMLLGDAVHTMTPTGAFGLNCSLKDADVLSLVIDVNQAANIDLITCATERQKEVAKLQAIQLEKEQSFASQFVMLV